MRLALGDGGRSVRWGGLTTAGLQLLERLATFICGRSRQYAPRKLRLLGVFARFATAPIATFGDAGGA